MLQAEQIAGPMGPDVLTLQSEEREQELEAEPSNGGGLAVATSPPRTRLVAESELLEYLPRAPDARDPPCQWRPDHRAHRACLAG